MNITILDNREIIIKTSDTFGTQNENKATVFNFSFPESLINANKKIVFITDDGVYWDLITNNSYKITNAVTKYKTVSAYVWLVDVEKDIDFRSKSLKITFNKNEEPDDVVPTEEEISGFDTMIAQLNTAIAEVDNIDIDAEKVGDTATVTITNKQGTQKSVEIKDGSDYIITEDDYREIANIVEADLPENYYNKTETNNLLDGKVDKETGKALIETSKIEKLDGIETGAEVNVVEDIKVNGTSLEVEEKAVNIPVPTELKDLTDDSTHRTVTDTEKNTWNNKANMSDIPDVSGFITKDVNNLTNYTLKTATGSLIDLEINSSNYVVSLNLKDIDGNIISTDTIDLPLENVVVGGSYDATNKKIVLTLENGNTVDIPVGDLIAGLQTEITSQNKLASDLVDDSNSGNKFVNTSEKQAWNAKYDKPAGGIPKTDLASSVGASLDKADSAIQEADLADYVKNTDYATSSKAGVIKTPGWSGFTTNSSGDFYPTVKDYATYDSAGDNLAISKGTLENVIAGKNLETADNKVTEIDENSTDTEYPSAKAVYEENKLLKDQIPNGTAEGTTVQITDSSNLPIEDGVIKGYTSQAILPTGYTQIDYIESTGTQYIDTNYTPVQGDSFEFKNVSFTPNSNSQTLFSAGTGNYQLIFLVAIDRIYFKYFSTGSAASLPLSSFNNANIRINNNGEVYINDVLKATVNYGGAVNTSLNLFRRANNAEYINAKIGEIIISNNNIIKKHYIPAQRNSDNAVGLYEIVGNIFYNNGGTGTFSKGDVAPNPNNKLDVHTVTGDCEVEVVSKNLLSPPSSNGTVTNIGMTFSCNKNNEYHLRGTSTSAGNVVINYSLENDYVIQENDYLHLFNDTIPTGTIQIVGVSTKGQIFASTITSVGKIMNLSAYAGKIIHYFFIFCLEGASANMTMTPMIINDISTATTYTPHAHQTFPISLGTIELCKIGDYQDYFYKDNGKWYKHQVIEKLILNGSETWYINSNVFNIRNLNYASTELNVVSVFSDKYTAVGNVNSSSSAYNRGNYTICHYNENSTSRLFIRDDRFTTVESFKDELQNNNVLVYYVLDNPVDIEITDTTLIEQLEAYYNASTYRNVTNIITAGEDLAPIASIVYKKDLTTLFNRLDSLEARVDLLE